MIENVKCPKCGGRMISRVQRATGERFWGCADYPKCNGTRNTDGEAPSERRREYEPPLPFYEDDKTPSERRHLGPRWRRG